MTAPSATTTDITGWSIDRVAGYLEAIRGDSTAVDVSITVRTDGERRMTMALTDEPPAEYVLHRCQACDAVTAAKVLPLPDLPGLKTPMALTAAGESNSEPKRTHDHRSNGTEFH
jgi:hypothetical protein